MATTNEDRIKILEEIVDKLEWQHRHATKMRLDMEEKIQDHRKAWAYWDHEKFRTLVQIEKYKNALDMWRAGIPVEIPAKTRHKCYCGKQCDESGYCDDCLGG